MGLIKRALRRTSRRLLSKIIPPAHSHQLVLNPQCRAGELAGQPDQMGRRKLASQLQRKFRKGGSSKDTAVAEALLLAVKNYLPPLQFHHVHGPHAQLSANRCVARRSQSFCQALVFSNRVILPNERVYIRVLEIAKCWSGTIRFGFTALDPATLACRVPKHACPDMTNAGHTWARALADEVVRRNSVIHFSYNKNGIIHYGINNQDCGVFHANVGTNQNLWFIVDIYGLTAAVELIDPRVNNSASAPLGRANNGAPLNFSHLADQEAAAAAAAALLASSQPAGRPAATMYKSTSTMDELFGTGRFGPAGPSLGRRKKLSRKHARHAALIQANWPLDGYPGANLLELAYNEPPISHQGAMQLPNLNSVSLPSAQQNIYSPMPNLVPEQQQQQQRRQQLGAGAARNEQHDYHQIVSNHNHHSNGPYQPLRVKTSPVAPARLTGSVSMANIAHSSVSSGATPSRQAPSISQADLSQQLENMHLHERRMRRQSAAAAKSSKPAASTSGPGQTPVAAARKRLHLQQIQTNLKRTPETQTQEQQQQQQLDKSSSSPVSSSKPTPGSSHASLKPRTRHSTRNQPKITTACNSNNDDSNPPSKDCPICFERPINCVLYQCGHMCTCYECGVKQWKTQSRTCPICRTVIKDVIKTYMS